MTGFEMIKKIYENMQDDVSKRIFIKRLSYALSGDKKEMDKLVLNEMERYGQEDIANRLVAWIQNRGEPGKPVNVFGAGFAGQQIVNVLRLKHIPVGQIYDNNPRLWGKRILGCRIEKPEKICPKELVVLGVNSHREEILEQLGNIGVRKSDLFVPDGLWWLGKYTQYFDGDILAPDEHEVFIDGGSLDGGDSVSFINWCNGKYDAVYAFEPDEGNLDKMYAIADRYSSVHICPAGLWNGDGELRFSSGMGENCSVSEGGNTVIRVSSIDNTLMGKPVTYIKLDIEGSEMEALKGAEETIRQYKPRLAVCVYHKPEDIIEIPKKILNPGYKFWMRHYSYLHTETVLYAVDDEDNKK